jgi:hypothetical protein
MSNDTSTYPIAGALKARLGPFLMNLTKELHGDSDAVAASLANLKTLGDLPAVYEALMTAPIFSQITEGEDGNVVPIISLRLAPQAMVYEGTEQIAVLIFDVTVTDPAIGRQVLARIILSVDELHIAAPNLSLNAQDDSQSEYHSGGMAQFQNLSSTVQSFMYHMLRAPVFKAGSAAKAMRDEALADLDYKDPMGFPLSGPVTDRIDALFAAVDLGLGLDEGAGLEAILHAKQRALSAGKVLTAQDLSDIIEPLRTHGLRLAMRASDGEISGVGLEFIFKGDNDKDVMSVLMGIGLDGDASFVSHAFSVHANGSRHFVDGAALMTLRTAREGVSASSSKAIADTVLRLAQAFGAFTGDDAAAEKARRQIVQSLNMPTFDVLSDPDEGDDA